MPKQRRKKKGRPVDLTPEIRAKIVNALALGNYIQTACQYAGIGVTTFYYWMERGERYSHRPGRKTPEEEQFIEFAKAVEKAQSEAEMKLVMSIEKKANGRPAEYDKTGKLIKAEIEADWRAAAWKLERKFPDRWGKRDQVKVFEADKGEDFRPDGSYEKMLELIHEIEEQSDKEE